MFSNRELVSRLAREKIEPHVKEMEARADILPEIRDLMFKNGVSKDLYSHTNTYMQMKFNLFNNYDELQ
jgi:hypothetical protein